MRAGMGRILTLQKSLIGLATATLPWLLVGCLNLRPLPPEILPNPPAAQPAAPLMPPREESLSGALDVPTLRLAMRDLAVILDTLGRLEQFRPEYKTQMLAELANADPAAEALESVPCEELREALLRQARDRADSLGPDANRARVQVALLELLSQSENSTENGNTLDPELWSHLAPAIEYCLGSAPAGG